MNNKLEDKCLYHNISREQRNLEILRGEGKKGTMGFEKQGCYECEGYNYNCDTYVSPAQLYKKGYIKGCNQE